MFLLAEGKILGGFPTCTIFELFSDRRIPRLKTQKDLLTSRRANACHQRWNKATVVEAPQAEPFSACCALAFQRTSRTVIVRNALSTVAIWKESLDSSGFENFPFIGESTRNE